ncbi:MAG: membrane protein insertion efficiency factor YidD [Parcubacteria group bacterium CG11_big_fil_rev_8_21_14_0_20_39_14]|nr:MAG: membrane protein insertion efficiency factor YidD [Parcubacteria group bacterium CG11_big_fil_rev_8_21_14_0_20_39_14]PIS35528.1 MAG: membrane protein insertion efficiency factor YidD [Parcubacteria group bacterium CG08_land_8_20_14_0_20_38_56]
MSIKLDSGLARTINKGCVTFLRCGIKAYQQAFSSIKGRSCRFYPTCSEYTLQALEKYGMIYGCFLGAKRILRCHPFNKGGHDPLPK